jgi:hypothetical protein
MTSGDVKLFVSFLMIIGYSVYHYNQNIVIGFWSSMVMVFAVMCTFSTSLITSKMDKKLAVFIAVLYNEFFHRIVIAKLIIWMVDEVGVVSDVMVMCIYSIFATLWLYNSITPIIGPILFIVTHLIFMLVLRYGWGDQVGLILTTNLQYFALNLLNLVY